MISNEGMTIENTGNVLIVRSERRGINWLGAAFAAFSIVWVLKWNRHDAQSEDIIGSAWWVGSYSFLLVSDCYCRAGPSRFSIFDRNAFAVP